MKSLRFDSVGGASGDMILGALIDLGTDATALTSALASLEIGPFTVEVNAVSAKGFTGTQATVRFQEEEAQEHRHLKQIRNLVDHSSLEDPVKIACLRVFERLAKAEAAVHNVSIDKVHFHEVGARDSIVDIVGCCLALHQLDVAFVSVGPLPIGKGTITCEHGVLPVPVPATVELLKGHPVEQTHETTELVTPTGAALLMEWQEQFGPGPASATLAAKGQGFGHRKLTTRPNMLRALLLETPASEAEDDDCIVLECNLDDTVPELLGSLTQRLLDAGALDVFTTPVQMKKQRPGILLTTLCHPADKAPLVDLIFTESTTFGIREHHTARTILRRRHVEVATRYGPVRVKIGTWKGQDITHAPEHDDCVKQSEAHGVPVRTVYEAAMRGTGKT